MKTNTDTPSSSAAPPSAPAAPAAAPSTPSAPAPSAPSSDHLRELTADVLPGGSREPSPQPSPEPEPAPTPEPQPVPKVKIRGIEYALDAVLKNPELSQALLQTYEQFPTLQKRYVELLEQVRQQAQPPAPAPVPQDPRVEQAQLLAQLAPEIGQIIRQGYIEEDFGTLYPNTIAQMVAHRNMLYELTKRFDTFEQTHRGQTRQAEATTHRTNLDANLDALAGKGELYAPLKDPTERQKFLEHLVQDVNPTVDRITPEWLMRQWVAFKHETILAATQATAERERLERETARRRAVSDGKGSRPTPAPTGEPSHLDFIIGDALPARR
jgi:hypothetical protein